MHTSRTRRILPVIAWLAIAALLLAGILRGFVVQRFTIPSESMEPALQPGQKITVWRMPALSAGIERGDVVVFDGRGSMLPGTGPGGVQNIASWFGIGPKDVFYVKRVIGTGGDEVVCCEGKHLTVNGEVLKEPYLKDQSGSASDIEFHVRVPEGRVWLMGDNRHNSTDSRNLLGRPGGGMVPLKRIIGTVRESDLRGSR
ncbi:MULTISPECIES: signal peptidase I [unclassified Brevibacterium]|uniref:signal peptidase I n=1 Tax=unclassified Brevibacterium TaxID=2614124 RepID=UPI0008A50F8F|nr:MULTISPECIES: signal peptidase I [unclassified Brevibacterium]OFL64926.1 S26 family signal peptidase [Brevibacterium sp. HMSC063G07]OFS25287.1 S26 family signal peptidase [Brevibacterium sp. HMSC07C04]